MNSQNYLTALPLELHNHIFSNLQPYDILQVCQTCKALYLASSQRTVWTDALHRICIDNTLFEPSFPVASMSVIELQRASMGPHRWIARSSSKERNSDGVLPHSVTRISAMPDLSIAGLQSWHVHDLVPGGRYLVALSQEWLVLWDLGSPYSSGREPHIIAAVTVGYFDHHRVHSTPDGMGLRVFLYTAEGYPDDMASLSIYEIYPENTSPQLTQISFTRIPGLHSKSFFSPSYDRLTFADGNILTVWDYKANTWARWGIEGEYSQIITTKSAVMLIRPYGISVWEIPPLLLESSLSMTSIMSPVLELHYPEDRHYSYLHQVPCDWYSGTPQPIYYDVAENLDADPLKIYRFEPTIDSSISGGTLNLLTTFEVPSIEDHFFSIDARICQDKNFSIYIDSHTGFLGTHVTDIYDKPLPSFLTPLCHHPLSVLDPTFCPVTGRVVYRETDSDEESSSIIVLDF